MRRITMRYVRSEKPFDRTFKPWKQELETARASISALDNISKPKGVKGRLQPIGAPVNMMKKGRHALPRFLPRHGRLMVR